MQLASGNWPPPCQAMLPRAHSRLSTADILSAFLIPPLRCPFEYRALRTSSLFPTFSGNQGGSIRNPTASSPHRAVYASNRNVFLHSPYNEQRRQRARELRAINAVGDSASPVQHSRAEISKEVPEAVSQRDQVGAVRDGVADGAVEVLDTTSVGQAEDPAPGNPLNMPPHVDQVVLEHASSGDGPLAGDQVSNLGGAAHETGATQLFDTSAVYQSHEDFCHGVSRMSGDPLDSADFPVKIVLHRGSPTARLMIIGEAPGRQEDAEGFPFVGEAGKLLDDIFTYAGFDMDQQVYVTNVVKRRPPSNRTPTGEEIGYYLPILMEEIRLVDPTIIVLAGAVPLKAVLNLTGITKSRGRFFPTERASRIRQIIPVFHPAYLLRFPSKKHEMKVDIDTIRAKYLELYPDDRLAPPRKGKPQR